MILSKRSLLLAFILMMLIFTVPAAAYSGDPAATAALPSAAVTTANTITALNLRPEPNTTRPPIAVIPGGATIDVFGRNEAATWLSVAYQGQQGWVSAAFVVLASGQPSDLPIVSPPGTPAAPDDAPPADEPMAFTPYVHNVTNHSREIFLDGQAKGNRANVFSKVGDSLTSNWAFLEKIGDGIVELHDYGHLQPVITYFYAENARVSNSFKNESLAAWGGWGSATLLDPAQEPSQAPGMCPGLSPPLICEYTEVRPAVAIIMIGTNDAAYWVDHDTYAANMGQIVQTSIDYGVIPVLSTIPYNSQGDDVQFFNEIIIATAEAYDIPWMDLYATTVNLPDHGLALDDVHLSVPDTKDPTNFTQENLQYGYPVRNLLVLHTLDEVWRQAIVP
jgi:hypothetical protein